MKPRALTVTVTLEKETFEIFREAADIAEKAGVHVQIGHLVQGMLNAEMPRHSPRKIAQRFLKSAMQQIGVPNSFLLEEKDEQKPSGRPLTPR